MVLPHKSKSCGGSCVGPECTAKKCGGCGLWCCAVERCDGSKERFCRESCGTFFTHLVTIFRVEFMWGCFVHFVGFDGDVVPVGCARISLLLLLLLLSSSSSPLCRVFIHIFLRRTMSLGNTVFQLFCHYYLWCLYH